MKDRLRRGLKTLRGIPVTAAYALRHREARDQGGSLFKIDLNENHYSRYLYGFCKFLNLSGHQVAFRSRPATIYSMAKANYGCLLVEKGLFQLGFKGAADLSDRDGVKRLEPIDFCKTGDPSIYDVPMAQHPLMYQSGCWNEDLGQTDKPSKSVLFVGNPDPEVYHKIGEDRVFGVMDRVTMWERLAKRDDARVVDCVGGLKREDDAGVLLMDSRDAQVDFKDFRGVLAGHRFFLCAPGVFMPLCHNLIEALSVGTIPVIQRAYAELLTPSLQDGKEAIFFEGEDDFEAAIDRCLSLGEIELAAMTKHAATYYETHLTPAAVAGRVLDPQVRVVRLLAGEHSVGLLRQRLAAN